MDEAYEAIMSKMNRDPAAAVLARGWPEFPRRFYLTRDAAGRKSYLEEVRPGVVSFLVEDAIQDAIVDYARNIAAAQNIPLSPSQGRICFQLWAATTPAIDAPQALVEQSAPGLAFTRLSFDAPPGDPSDGPASFLGLLARCSQPTAVAAFVGSLFYPDADRSQYLYLFGQGNDGKGTLLSFLNDMLGTAAIPLAPPEGSNENRWFNMNTYGKRLVYFADCDSPKFFSSAKFKSLTGNDAVFYEPKGLMGFSAYPACKFIAASNAKPRITSQTSDQRRLIFVEFRSLSDDSIIPKFKERLAEDAQAIVSYCKAVYLAEAPGHSAIFCDKPAALGVENEEAYAALFHRHFDESRGSAVAGDRVLWVLKSEGIRGGQEIGRIKAAWERIFGIVIEPETAGPRKGCMVYRNMTWAPKDYTPFAVERVE